MSQNVSVKGGTMKYFLAFDVGTTAMKCILYDKNFNEVFECNEEYSLSTPENNRVELLADTYFDVFCKNVKKLWENGIKGDDILTLTFTTQGETLIPVDKDGNPLLNAIVWLDSRGEKEAEEILGKINIEDFYAKTGLPGLDGALPLAKLMWIKKNCPDIYDNTYKFMLLEDYLIQKLTDEFVTEKSLASSTGWLDIVKGEYFEELIKACGIDSDKLPGLMDCGKKVSNISAKASKITGLSEKTMVVTGAMDQVASAIGAGNTNEGIITETTGTALVLGATVKKPDLETEDRITVYRHFDDKFLYMPYCPTAGIVLKWFKDNMAGELKQKAKELGVSVYTLIDEEAQKAEPGCDGVRCLAHFSGKEGIDNAKGVFFGITLKTKMPELSRSVLEGVSCMLFEQVENLKKTGIEVKEIYSLGGGSYSDIWTGIKASMCNVSFKRTDIAQSTALGAAILGAVAVGEYRNVDEAFSGIKKNVKITKPDENQKEAYKTVYEEYCRLYNVLANEF